MSAYSAEEWPVAAKMAYGPRAKDGSLLHFSHPQWRQQVDQIARMGHTALDPTDDWLRFWELDAAQTADFLAYVRSRGLSIPSLSMGRRSVVDVNHGEEYLAITHRVIDLAPEYGASVVNIGFMQPFTQAQKEAEWFWLAPGHVDDPALRDTAVKRVRELAEHAESLGIQLSLEMYEDTFIGMPRQAVEFIDDVNRDNVGLNPDLGNLVRLHRPMPGWAEMYDMVLPFSNFWHIKNYVRDFDPATGAYFTFPASLATGVINYRQVIEKALDCGFSGPFVVEHYGNDWLGIGVENMRFIRSVIADYQATNGL